MAQIGTLAAAFDEICQRDAPLSVRLSAYADKLREFNSPFAAAYDNLIARLNDVEAGAQAPAVGEIMPPFLLPAEQARLVGLDELIAKGPAVVSFDRGHWCPFCRIALRSFASFQDELEVWGAQVVSIVPDRQEFAQRLRSESFEKLHVVTDIDNGYALSLGLTMWLGDEIKGHMIERGYQLSTYQGNDGWYVPIPATFIVGRDGRVVARFVDPDFRKRMDIEVILDALKAEFYRSG